MFWSKKTRHPKEFYSSLDVAVRRKENALCALALKAAPLSPSPMTLTPFDQGTIQSFFPKTAIRVSGT